MENTRKTGRPKGSKDRQPRHTAAFKQARDAAKGGIMPLDVMLKAMRDTWAAAEREDDDARRQVLVADAFAFAVAAAPYCHPKMASVQHSGELRGGMPLVPIINVMVGEPEAKDSNAWARRHGPAGAVATGGVTWHEQNEGEGDV